MKSTIDDHLSFLYGAEQAGAISPRLQSLLQSYQIIVHPLPPSIPPSTEGSGDGISSLKPPPDVGGRLEGGERLRYQGQIPRAHSARRFDETDAILITYGDMVHQPGEQPLQTLGQFLANHLHGAMSCVHLLPFFPYSSDDGFSVIDYKMVDPALGDWDDVARIGRSFRLMFDAVVNHISAQSDWFQAFTRDEAPYRDFFTVVEPDTDLSTVFRPRTLPLLTPVETAAGPKHVWTTFSADQIDLNYANPDVLLAVIDTLLFYVAQGAEFIRLDAIAFIWKEVGTSCIHLPQTHRIIQLLRAVLDEVAPQVAIITETNVPHEDNIAYFGDGRNEAQMVYNFSLPPLTLHAFHTGNAEILSRWASTLTLPSGETTFFNFLASHDGIGVTPARGLLSDAEITRMAQRVEALGGYVSYKNNSDGSRSAYELNINYLDALGDPEQLHEEFDLMARRFLASQAILLALRGVPGIYFHSLFGSRSWRAGVKESGRFRTINRQKLGRQILEEDLADPNSLRHRVFHDYGDLLRRRTTHPAFDPNGGQQVIFCHEYVFALLRTSADGHAFALCLHNVANDTCQLTVDLGDIFTPPLSALTDLISGRHYPLDGGQLILTLAPYQILWLTEQGHAAQYSLDI